MLFFVLPSSIIAGTASAKKARGNGKSKVCFYLTLFYPTHEPVFYDETLRLFMNF